MTRHSAASWFEHTVLQELKSVLDNALVAREGEASWNDSVRSDRSLAGCGLCSADLWSEGDTSTADGGSVHRSSV
jgi:hypothetical protein